MEPGLHAPKAIAEEGCVVMMGAGRPVYGGQAVIEGVMMRGPRRVAVAVRRPDGSVFVSGRDVIPWGERWPLLKLPVVRGAVAVVEALVLGLDALMFSANQAAEEEEEQLTKGEMTITMVVAAAAAVIIFVLLPTWAVRFAEPLLHSSFARNLLEGVLRLLILGGYLAGISLMPDIQRVLQYHGAEHKVIHAWEAGDDLTVENARRYSTLHPRCGTSFLLFLALISIVVFALTGWPNVWERLAVRLGFFPVVAGVAYEVIRFSGRLSRGGSPAWLLPFILPGLWFQKMTTREPDDAQLEVAIAALRATLDGEPAGA